MLNFSSQHPVSRRVCDVLLDRLDEPWSVDRLAGATGLSSRTLFRLTRREFGMSPMALLREARLARARSELETAGPVATVTSVALDCGFAHLGRFSQEYARRFGELPSQTLRRGRRRPARSGLEVEAAVPVVRSTWSNDPGQPVAGMG